MEKKHFSAKKRGRIAVAVVWLGAITALFANSVSRWCLWIGLAIAVAGVLYRAIMVRCPHCGDKLSGYQSVPDRCPRCGESLD